MKLFVLSKSYIDEGGGLDTCEPFISTSLEEVVNVLNQEILDAKEYGLDDSMDEPEEVKLKDVEEDVSNSYVYLYYYDGSQLNLCIYDVEVEIK